MMWDNSTIKRLVKSTDSVLDLGCGNRESFRGVKCANYVGVDLWKKSIPDVIHDLKDVPYPFPSKSFDVVAALDCIEHLDRDHGQAMLREMKRIACRLLIVFTPKEFRDNAANVDTPGLWSTGNVLNLHQSLWGEQDFAGWQFMNYVDPGYIFCCLEISCASY